MMNVRWWHDRLCLCHHRRALNCYKMINAPLNLLRLKRSSYWFSCEWPYSTWKYKVSQAIMCHERESWRAWCALYPSLIYYAQSVEDISMCSWWKLAINIPKLREACRGVMTPITSFNITNRGRWCELCDSFEPNTLDQMVAECNCCQSENWIC